MKVAFLLALLLSGCVSYAPVGWTNDPSKLDRTSIQLSGRPVYSDVYGLSLYLCPLGYSGEDANGACIDILASHELITKLRRGNAQCVVVSGAFRAYGHSLITTGYLRSNIGMVKARRAARCHGR